MKVRLGEFKILALTTRKGGGCEKCPRCLQQGLAGDVPKAVLLLHLHLVPGALLALPQPARTVEGTFPESTHRLLVRVCSGLRC